MIAVGATNSSGRLWSGSVTGPEVAITAPGVDIVTTGSRQDFGKRRRLAQLGPAGPAGFPGYVSPASTQLWYPPGQPAAGYWPPPPGGYPPPRAYPSPGAYPPQGAYPPPGTYLPPGFYPPTAAPPGTDHPDAPRP